MSIQIHRAQAGDRDDLVRLVEQNHLPLAGLDRHLGTALVARQDDRAIGTAALEVYPDGALLRSVAVAPDVQRRGVGHLLTDAAMRLARELGVAEVYLLTTTAEAFFPKFGFVRVERAEVPAGVRTSVEFTSACPASAVVMRKTLTADG